MMDDVYSPKFYDVQMAGSTASAEAVVPHILSLFQVSSVVDVGCGVGGWLQVFDRHGVKDYLGVDGDYIPRDKLKVAAERFRAADLTALPDLGRPLR